MAYNEHDRRSRQGSGSSGGGSRQRSQGLSTQRGGARIPVQGPYHGPRGTRSRVGAPRRSKGPGYPLRSRNINFQSGRARRMSDNRRLLILAVAGLLVIILLVVGISSCMRACSSANETTETNPVDARVAVGVSEDLTRQFSAELDRGEKLAWIAANANRYENQGLLELALAQPDAIEFVAAYPEAEKVAQAYGEDVSAGTVPELYTWDARWGYVDYAGAPFALTGSGPTALAMVRMSLLGNADQTPATIAEAVSAAEMATGDSSMSGSFLEDSEQMSALGLSCTTYSSNADNLLQALDAGTYVLVEASAGSLGESARWIVVVSENEDGSVVVLDPTSPELSGQTLEASTVAAAGETLYLVSSAEDSSEE